MSPYAQILLLHSFVPFAAGELRVAFVAERLRRYVQVVVTFGGVGSSPTECNTFFLLGSCTQTGRFVKLWQCSPSCHTPHCSSFMPQHLGSQKAPHEATRDKQKKGYGGTGIRARVERITTANANHYTIPPRHARKLGTRSQDWAARTGAGLQNHLNTIALIAQLGER
jgi:hypothetical protein